MRFSNTRTKILTLGATSVLALTIAGAAAAEEAAKHNVDIEAQKLASALLEFSEQSDVLVAFPPELVNGRQAPAVKGDLTTEDALGKLLQGSGLNYSMGSDGGVTIVQTAALNEEGRRERGFLRLAQADVPSGRSVSDTNAPAEMQADTIIVTANRREQNLQDVPASVSVIGDELIDKRGFTDRTSFLNTLPGVTGYDRGLGDSAIIIRGLATDPQTEPEAVGVYFGETPLTGLGSNRTGGGQGSVDLRLVDVERVELLRGPQGTLFGSGSLGGTLRVLPKAPDLDEFGGYISGEYSNTDERGGSNYAVEGALNVPIVQDRAALRITGYYDDDSGYIDNVIEDIAVLPGLFNEALRASGDGVERNEGDIGAVEVSGIRAALLIEPTDALSVKISHIWQDAEQNGIPEVNLDLPGDFQQVRFATGLNGERGESLTEEINITNLEVQYEFELGTFISSTSFVDHETSSEVDLGFAFFGVAGFQTNSSKTDQFIQEVRFVSDFEGPFQFQGGVYYEDIDRDSFSGTDSASTAFGPTFFPARADVSTQLEQFAVFGEVSYDIFDSLTLTLGARHFDFERPGEQVQSGGAFATPNVEALFAEDSGETYRVNLSYEPVDDILLYAQWAQGFRLASSTTEASFSPNCDADNNGLFETADGREVAFSELESDSNDSYEVGFKSTLANGRAEVNGAIYYNDWEGLPVVIPLACGAGIRLNAGTAQTYGAELESRVRLTDSIVWNLAASYNEAELTEDAPNLGPAAVDGAELPGSADWQFSTGLEYGFVISNYDAYVRADYSYISEYASSLGADEDAGDFGLVDLRAGVDIDNARVSVFIKNVTNEYAFIARESALSGVINRGAVTRPRTIGVKVGYDF